MSSLKLITLSEWRELPSKTQGYVWYTQAELPGSELKDQVNPYLSGTCAYDDFVDGARRAIIEVQ